MKKCAVLIVIYNCPLGQSDSYAECIKYKDLMKIIVIDNSEKQEILSGNQDKAFCDGAEYIGSGGNIGLSRAYNKGLRFIREKDSEIEWAVILDQDTRLNESFFKEVLDKSSRSEKNKIYYPQVFYKSRDKLLSPIKMPSFYCKKGIMCINSGLLVSMDVFDKLQYNEALFLDMVDFDLFCQVYEKTDIVPEKLDTDIIQDFSGGTYAGSDKDFRRFQILVKDYIRFSRSRHVFWGYKCWILGRRTLRLTLHYKELKFAKELFRQIKESRKEK